jgi:hypothetical protein
MQIIFIKGYYELRKMDFDKFTLFTFVKSFMIILCFYPNYDM